MLVPAIDYDPVTSEDLSELVEVAEVGVVTTWSWNAEPRAGQPLGHPFAWALITLDGADTALLAAVDAAPRVRSRPVPGCGRGGRRSGSARSAT